MTAETLSRSRPISWRPPFPTDPPLRRRPPLENQLCGVPATAILPTLKSDASARRAELSAHV
jgi:hypothetical protein